MESITSIIEYRDSLFEQVENDINGNKEEFDKIIQELCDTAFLECCTCPSDDTLIMFKTKNGLKWSSIVELSDPIKKKILLQLIDNPKCFFVLFNTQKGKLRIIGEEIASWQKIPNKRVVSFLVVDNDRTLSEQSVNGLFNCFTIKEGKENSNDIHEKYDVRIFELSSNNKVQFSDITTYIDAYAYNNSYSMPLVVVLANPKQIEKLIKIIYHVITHDSNKLCIGGAWDEADKTYPLYREKIFNIHGKSVCFKDLLNHESERLFRNGFITATEGELIEEDFDECANAYHYPVEIDPEDAENYFAFHHTEAIIHRIKVRNRESNNLIAERVLAENWDTHFKTPLKLRNGHIYHHKIIVNSDTKAEEMERFANKHRSMANIITFNMHGLKLYTENHIKKYSARKKHFNELKKKSLNELLFYIYKKNNLEERPLIVIGRRKVDRGLGFHYAPRKYGKKKLEMEGDDGKLNTDGVEGLIWTDMIIGNKIEHIPTAVQKAGRGAGIIRQCPQYAGEFHYWIDVETSAYIMRHYKKVDKVNELKGTNSILQAVSHAESIIPIIKRNHNVDPSTFRVIKATTTEETLTIMQKIMTEIFNLDGFRKPRRDKDDNKFYATSLNNASEKVSLIEAIKKVPGAYGTNNKEKTYRRYLASYKDLLNENSLCCVIPLIDPYYTIQMKEALDNKYSNYIINIPQEEEF